MPIRLPVVAGILGIVVGVRYLARRLNPNLVKLPSGHRVRLLSSVALSGRSSCGVLALEYVSRFSDPEPDELEAEAIGLLQTASQRPEYALCVEAIVTPRLAGEDPVLPPPEGRALGFRRFGPTSPWYCLASSD
jgi:hypothetical protein